MLRRHKPIKRTGIKRKRRKWPESSLRYRRVDGVRIYDDGREVCDVGSMSGHCEYRSRVSLMVTRQDFRCCICLQPFKVYELPTFEHENGRGGGKQDDRIEIDGVLVNGASHEICNSQRGSKRAPIWHGELK